MTTVLRFVPLIGPTVGNLTYYRTMTQDIEILSLYVA